MAVDKITSPATPLEVVNKINEVIDNQGGGGGGSTYTAGDGINIANDVISADIATSVSSSSTNKQSVGAKLFYDTCGDIETLINAL